MKKNITLFLNLYLFIILLTGYKYSQSKSVLIQQIGENIKKNSPKKAKTHRETGLQTTKKKNKTRQKKTPKKSDHLGDQKKTNTQGAIEVNETEMAIKKRAKKYVYSLPDNDEKIFFQAFLQHPYFFKKINNLLGNLTKSVEKSDFLLDEKSMQDLRVLEGSMTKPSHNLANTLIHQIGLKLPVAKCGLVLQIASLNNDKDRILKYNHMIRSLLKHSKEATFSLSSIYKKSQQVFIYQLAFLLRKVIPIPIIQLVEGLVDIKHDPTMWWLVAMGIMDEKTLLQSKQSVALNKFMKVFFGTLENIADIVTSYKPIQKVFYTIQYVISLLTFRLIEMPEGEDKPTVMNMGKAAHERMPFLVFDFFYQRIKAFCLRCTGKGKWWHIISGGDDEWHEGLRTNVKKNSFISPSRSLGAGSYSGSPFLKNFSIATYPVAWIYHCCIQFSRYCMHIYFAVKDIKSTLEKWQKATINMQDFLKHQAKGFGLIKEAYDLIEANPELAKELDGPILAAIKKLATCPKIIAIMKEINKMPVKKPTLWQIFLPWNKESVVSFVLYQRLAHLSAKYQKILLEGTLGFALLEIFQAFALQAYLSEKNLVKDKICLSDISDQKKPAIAIQAGYTPLIVGTKVVNDFNIGSFENAKKQARLAFIDGQTGSGKTSMIYTLAHNIITNQFAGMGLAKYLQATLLDKVYFSGGESGKMEEHSSAFIEVLKSMKKTLAEVQTIHKLGKNMLLLSDEPMAGKTFHPEAIAILYPYFKKTASFSDVIGCVATHDLELFKLAKEEKYRGFLNYTTEYDEITGQYTYKVKKGMLAKPDSIYMLDIMNWDKALKEESIEILRKDKLYPFRHLLPGKQDSKMRDPNVWVDILILLFFISGSAAIVYQRWRRRYTSSDEEQTTSAGE